MDFLGHFLNFSKTRLNLPQNCKNSFLLLTNYPCLPSFLKFHQNRKKRIQISRFSDIWRTTSMNPNIVNNTVIWIGNIQKWPEGLILSETRWYRPIGTQKINFWLVLRNFMIFHILGIFEFSKYYAKFTKINKN